MDNISYEYEKIDQAVQEMLKTVNTLKEHTDGLANDTKRTMGESWSGDAATSYEGKSQEIHKALDEQGQHLTMLHQKISGSSQNMQDTDRSGARTLSG